jgi:hypothetical protein
MCEADSHSAGQDISSLCMEPEELATEHYPQAFDSSARPHILFI